jgi:hypothetical protein
MDKTLIMYHLVSNDNVTFDVKYGVIEQSNVLRSLINDVNDDNNTIPILIINCHILKLIIEFCERRDEHPEEHYNDDKMNGSKFEIKNDWDKKFLQNMTYDVLFNLYVSANYLDINELFNIIAAYIATKITEKTPDQIREIMKGVLPDQMCLPSYTVDDK